MFDTVLDFFESKQPEHFDLEPEKVVQELQLACCVLLLETAFVDLRYPRSEQRAILDILIEQFGLDETKAEELIALAGVARHQHERISIFIDLINHFFDDAQRQLLYAAVWKVIKADDIVDKREREVVIHLGQLLKLSVDQEIEARKMIIDGKI